MLEPGYIAIIVTVILALLGGGMYVIRSEVVKGNRTTADVHVEMVPNHGSSLRDAIDRIEGRQVEDRATFLAHVANIHSDIRTIRTRQDQHLEHHDRKA